MADEMDRLKEWERICSVQTTQDDCEAIIDHATLLAVLNTSPDVETCLAEANRVLWLIVGHAQAIQARDMKEKRLKVDRQLRRRRAAHATANVVQIRPTIRP